MIEKNYGDQALQTDTLADLPLILFFNFLWNMDPDSQASR